MNNQEILSKLINGTENTVKFEFEGLDAPITLRPLTSGEILILQKVEKKNQKFTIRMEKDARGGKGKFRDKVKKEVQKLENEIDAEQLRESVARTKFKAVSISADISEDMVEQLPSALVEAIFDKVVEISKLTKKDLDLLAEFHEDE